jgi:hypothetical protein
LPLHRNDLFYALLFLEDPHTVRKQLAHFMDPSVELALLASEGSMEPALEHFDTLDSPAQRYVLECACTQGKEERIHSLNLPPSLLFYRIWALLLEQKIEEAGSLLNALPSEDKTAEHSPLYFLAGCYLASLQGKEAAVHYFASLLSDSPKPRLATLLGHYLTHHISLSTPLFFWEQVQLMKQLILFYRCTQQYLLERKMHARLRRYISTMQKNRPPGV